MLNEGLFRDRQGIADRRKAEGFANILFIELGKSLGYVTGGISMSRFTGARDASGIAAGTTDMRRAEELGHIANGIQKAIDEGLPRLPFLASQRFQGSKLVNVMDDFINSTEKKLDDFYNMLLKNPQKYRTPQNVMAAWKGFVEIISEELEKITGLRLKQVSLAEAGIV